MFFPLEHRVEVSGLLSLYLYILHPANLQKSSGNLCSDSLETVLQTGLRKTKSWLGRNGSSLVSASVSIYIFAFWLNFSRLSFNFLLLNPECHALSWKKVRKKWGYITTKSTVNAKVRKKTDTHK
jgi:hypothetical protein